MGELRRSWFLASGYLFGCTLGEVQKANGMRPQYPDTRRSLQPFRQESVLLLHCRKMKKHQLGGFEEIVLLAVGILHGNAYTVTLKDEIENRLRREVSIGSL